MDDGIRGSQRSEPRDRIAFAPDLHRQSLAASRILTRYWLVRLAEYRMNIEDSQSRLPGLHNSRITRLWTGCT